MCWTSERMLLVKQLNTVNKNTPNRSEDGETTWTSGFLVCVLVSHVRLYFPASIMKSRCVDNPRVVPVTQATGIVLRVTSRECVVCDDWHKGVAEADSSNGFAELIAFVAHCSHYCVVRNYFYFLFL